MSAIHGLPDESWPEEKVLELLNASISGSGEEERRRRLVCLDELQKRETIKQVDKVMETLLDYAKIHGRSTPASSMITKVLSRLANSEETAFRKMLNTTLQERNDNLLYCFARITLNLEDVKKKECMLLLVSLLMLCDSFTNITEEMCQTLVSSENGDINKGIVDATTPHLQVPRPVEVLYAVRIVCALSSEFISGLESVIERALDGWYDARRIEILKNICDYFGRIKEKKGIPYLLQILKKSNSRNTILFEELSKALASILDAHPEMMEQIWEFLEKHEGHHPSILKALAEMKTHIDLEKLFSGVKIDWSKWEPKEALKRILINEGDISKPFLLEMIKEKDQNCHSFTLECLEELGVSIEEYSKVFEKPPILQVFEFFHRKRKNLHLENLWREQDNLRNPIKGAKMDKLEYFMHHFFSALGFVTLFVDPSGKKGVDLVAFHPTKPHILIIGCTTGIIKEDLQKMNNTLIEMEETLEELLKKYRTLPIIITSKKVMVTNADREYAGENEIAILAHQETTKLLEMLRTNRTIDEIMDQIKLSIPPAPDDNNPYV